MKLENIKINNFITHDFTANVVEELDISVPNHFTVCLKCNKCHGYFYIFSDYTSVKDNISMALESIKVENMEIYGSIELNYDCNSIKFKNLLG